MEMNTLIIIGIIVGVGVLWLAYEICTAPLMPDDYGLSDKERKLWKDLQSHEESKKKESHGKLGGNLEDVHMRNSNNKGISNTLEEDYENQPFGD